MGFFSRRVIAFISMALIVSGCGSSDSGDGSGTSSNGTSSGGQSAQSIDARAGTYSLAYSAVSMSCTDGSEDSLPGASVVMDVSVTDRFATIVQSASSREAAGDRAASSGVTITSSSPVSGVVEMDSTFIATGASTSSSADVGAMRTVYTLAGKFTESGWSGDYSWSIVFSDLSVTCDYKAKFSGSKTN